MLAAISVSTLLVKQLLIVDVVAGIVLAFVAWAAAERLYRRAVEPAAEPREALRQVFRLRRWRAK